MKESMARMNAGLRTNTFRLMFNSISALPGESTCRRPDAIADIFSSQNMDHGS